MADMSINQDSLTLEETNKVRVSLGLKPIGGTTDGEPEPPSKEEIAEANFAARREEERRAKAERETRERIEKAKNQRALHSKLKGSTLADAAPNDDALSAKSWIKTQKKRAAKREAELAARRQREMDEADNAATYDERDLLGLKVAHGADDFAEGEDVVLTLRDSRVLDGDEDELQNVNLADYEADKEVKERKRKARQAYTGYDDDEFGDESRVGSRPEVLAKYDEEFSGGKKVRTEGFRLGAPVEKKAKVVEDVEMLGSEPATRIKLNLEFTKDFEVSDYMKEGDPGFKKPKKRRAKKSTRRAEVEDDGMDVDPAPTFARRVVGEGPENLVDDDDLQAALARTRRENAKKKPRVKPEDIAARIAKQREEEVKEEEDDAGDDGRITFDETSEFVRNVTTESRAAPVKTERRSRTPASPAPGPSTNGGEDAPVVVKVERVDVDGGDESEDEDEDDALAEMAAREGLSLAEYRARIDSQMAELSEMAADEVKREASPEPLVSQGLAGTLKMLEKQGAVKKRTAADDDRDRHQKQHDLWLADHRRRAAERELERIAARGGNKDQAQREYENRIREQQEARDALELFKNYKPDIKLEYHDEFGRQMTPKEAWKSLSHKFHGKTSGRMKTEKRLRKIDEERKAAAMAASDTPTGMADAFARRQVKTGEAHMVLSAGNKGSVQMDAKPRRR